MIIASMLGGGVVNFFLITVFVVNAVQNTVEEQLIHFIIEVLNGFFFFFEGVYIWVHPFNLNSHNCPKF